MRIVFNSCWIAAALLWCAPAYGASKHSKPRDTTAVNAVLGDISWTEIFGAPPPGGASEQARIQAHLAYVEGLLRADGPAGLDSSRRERRRRSLDALARYRIAQQFPRNDRVAGRRPRLMDTAGRLCAVGHLIAASGNRALLEELTHDHEWDYLEDIDEPRFLEWASTNGFAPTELAMIQPTYEYRAGPQPARPTSAALAHAYASLQRRVQSCAFQTKARRGTLITLDVSWPAEDPLVFEAESSDDNGELEKCVALAARHFWVRRYGPERFSDRTELEIRVRFRVR